VIVAAVVIWYVMRQREAAARPEKLKAANVAAAQRASAQGLQLGDVVNFDGSELVVQGTIRYSQGSFTWAEHLLVDGGTKRWLSVEDDEGVEVAVWEKGVDPDISPGEKRVDHEGTTYVLDEHGHAKFMAEGTTGTGPAGDYEYFDYEAGDLRLSFERYDKEGAWELSLGHVINEAALDVYPAGSRS
jgi:hypothetical protein